MLSKLMNGLCEYLRIEPLEPDSRGFYEVVFDDGLDVEILLLSDSQMLVRSQIATIPEDKDQREAFFRTHLQNNLLNLQGQFCSLSLDSEQGVLWLSQMARCDKIDVPQFCTLIGDFVTTLEWWNGLEKTSTSFPAGGMLPYNIIRP